MRLSVAILALALILGAARCSDTHEKPPAAEAKSGDMPPEYWSERFENIEGKIDEQAVQIKDIRKDVNKVSKQVEEIRLQNHAFSQQLEQLGYTVEE